MKLSHTWSLAASVGVSSVAVANVAPTVVIESAMIRVGTTYMDVVYRVNDPDDATVKVRALAFVDGARSFAKAIKPTTFVEGTAANLGDAVSTNTLHTLTWDVGVDWNVTLGQVKFEVLARDGRGLLPFEWLTIPSAAGKPAITVGDIALSTAKFDALAWLLADNHPDLRLDAGKVIGTSSSSRFAGITLADGYYTTWNGDIYLLKAMNVMPATVAEYDYAMGAARISIPGPGASAGHVKNTPYTGVMLIETWGAGNYPDWTLYGKENLVKAVYGPGGGMIALDTIGVMHGSLLPSGAGPYTDIAGSPSHYLAIKADGSVVAWGGNNVSGPLNVPANLGVVKSIAAGGTGATGLRGFSVVVKQDGTVVAWGSNSYGQCSVPTGLADVVSVAAGIAHTLAIKSDGTLVAWGQNAGTNLIAPPPGLTGVVAASISLSGSSTNNSTTHTLALKSDGTVVAWGYNGEGQTNVPVGLSGVVAVSAGTSLSMALKSDGTVVTWGSGANAAPRGLTHATSINARGVVLINDIP
jgi:hypothetical protein